MIETTYKINKGFDIVKASFADINGALLQKILPFGWGLDKFKGLRRRAVLRIWVGSKMHKFKGDTSPRKIYLLVINNPCSKEDFPSEVNKGYFCNKDNSLDTNQVFSVKGKLVIGLLHDGKVCSKEDINKIDSDSISGVKCRERNSTPLNKLNYGMSDIFIKMAK